MTTIESAQGPHKDLEIEPITVNDGDWLLTIRNRRLDEAMAIAVDALPLYKAINAVPDYEHEREIQHALAERDEWKTRAEAAEAKLAEAEFAPAEVLVEGSWFKPADLPAVLGNHMRSLAKSQSREKDSYIRVEVAEGKLREAEKDLRDLRAKVESVAFHQREWQRRAEDPSRDPIKYRTATDVYRLIADDLALILDLPEPFVLPTEAGAGIVATYKQTGEDKELRLFKDGKWRSSSGRTYTPERVMDFFGCHRLIEAAG
jgi:hypothetical protein